MPFVGSVRLSTPKPTILYMHETGYTEAFGDGRRGMNEGIRHTENILVANKQMVDPATYILAALWGDKGKRVAELWGYGEFKDWSENPTLLRTWVFKDGVYVPEPQSIGCEDTTIVFGAEGKHRRTCKGGLREFISRHPELPDYTWAADDGKL